MDDTTPSKRGNFFLTGARWCYEPFGVSSGGVDTLSRPNRFSGIIDWDAQDTRDTGVFFWFVFFHVEENEPCEYNNEE